MVYRFLNKQEEKNIQQHRLNIRERKLELATISHLRPGRPASVFDKKTKLIAAGLMPMAVNQIIGPEFFSYLINVTLPFKWLVTSCVLTRVHW